MISLNEIRPFLTAGQKRQMKAAVSMIGHILWDPDYVPIDDPEWRSYNLGTSNMPAQFWGMRHQVACLLKEHPQFAAKFPDILNGSINYLIKSTTVYGGPKDSTHYAGALIGTTLDEFRQLQVSGYADVFAPGSTINARLTGLAEWTMQIITPPQSRFGGCRKMVVFGDAWSESSDLFIDFIMGFEPHNLTLSKRMAAAWISMGQPYTSFYSSSGMKIRPNFPTQDPALGDYDFPGNFTVMRSGWGTANESAVFLLHGAANMDHSTFQRGSISLYLLGAPVCISFGSMGSPKISGPWIGCSSYIPVSEIAYGYDPPIYWDTANTNDYINLGCGAHSAYFDDTYVYNPTTNRVDLTCTFAVSGWVRHLTYYRDVVAQPIVRLRDSNTAGESVFTLHMMANGAVTKPDGGTVTPTALAHTPFAVPNGGCIKFTGQWGVSWDVYYFGPAANAFVGVWSHTFTGGLEQAQYLAATGQSFEEKQYLLRIKTNGPCDVVVVPYFTGQRPANLNVVQVAGGLRVDSASRTLAN
jgi:hypothetical protein